LIVYRRGERGQVIHNMAHDDIPRSRSDGKKGNGQKEKNKHKNKNIYSTKHVRLVEALNANKNKNKN